MNHHDERRIFPVDAQRKNSSSLQNSSNSTIKIDSLCIKLGFLKEKGDAETCSHFSIRGFVSGRRERGSSSFLPFAEELPPMDVPNFKYWLCQSCLKKCGNANTSFSHKTPVVSVCDQSMIQSCVRSFPQQDCGKVAVLPFGEGTSGLKSVDNTKDGDDDDENVLPAFGVNESQPSQEIHVDNVVPKEPIKFSDTNVASEANAGLLCRKDGRDDDEDPQQDSVVIETITGLVGTPIKSSQQNDQSNGHTRRKARKVRLLKELLCGNNEINQREKENSNTESDPKPCPLPTSSLIKRKLPHVQDQTPVDINITTPVNACKKAKTIKGNAVAKTTIVDQHSKDPGVISSDPVTAWRSIFSDMTKTDNHITTTTSTCKPTYDISKDKGSGPHSNIMAPPHPEKKSNFSINMSKNPLKSKSFGEEYTRRGNADDCSRPKDQKSETELGLNLSLNYDPQTLYHHTPTKEYHRKGVFCFVDWASKIKHWIPSDSKSKEASVDDVSNKHASKPVPFQKQQSYTYGSWSGHQKLDFSDPHKRNNNGVMKPQNHQRQGSMVFLGRSDEREIVELMAKNQYERNLCEARSSNNNTFIPHVSGLHNIKRMTSSSSSSSHQDFIHPSTSHEKSNTGPTIMRNQASGFFNQGQFSDFNNTRRNNTRYSYFPESYTPKLKKKKTNVPLGPYQPRKQYPEGCNRYKNDKHEKEIYFSKFPTKIPNGYTKSSEKDNQKNIMDLDLNVVAPNVTEEQNNFESLNTTSSKEHHPKNMKSLDSSYPNETIPAMQLLSLMDAGKSKSKSNHRFSSYVKKFPKPLSPCYNTHCNSNIITGKTIPIPNVQFPNSKYFQSSSFPCGFQTGQNVKLTSYKPQEEKSFGFPVPCHVSEDRSEVGVSLRDRIERINGNEICTINKNPADFSTPGPENEYMINVEDLVFRGEKRQKGKKRS